MIDEFARWTADELDYLVEARQAVLLYEQARGERLERIARVYRGYTTSLVLTSELIEGIPLLEVLTAVRQRPAYLAALDGARLRPAARRPAPGLEHAQPGVRLRLLPRRPAPGQPVRAARQRHRVRRLRRRRPAPGRAATLADPRYGWLLFRRDVEAATGELLRWLAPASERDAALARQRLVRIHQAFLYDLDAAAGAERAVAPPGRDGVAEEVTARTPTPGSPWA